MRSKDLADLRNDVLLKRQIYSPHIVKLGLDGGGGFLKVSLGIQEVQQRLELRSPPSKKTLATPNTRDSGVKKQLSTDLKLANIICGLQSHASSHPCTWCYVFHKNLALCNNPQTFRLRQCFEDFKNVVHLPLLNVPDSALALDIISPIKLYLLLGVVNHLYSILRDSWSKVSAWLNDLNIKPQPFHCGQFDGNKCRKMLKNVDLLHRMAEQDFTLIDFLQLFVKLIPFVFV